MDIKIAVIKGDGIGPSVVDQAILVLNRIGEIYGHKFEFEEVLAGGCYSQRAYRRYLFRRKRFKADRYGNGGL